MMSLGIMISYILQLYFFVVIASVVMTWLLYFRVINLRHPVVAMIANFLYAATEPVYRRIRRYIPIVGQFDLSPLIVILGIIFAQMLIDEYWI